MISVNSDVEISKIKHEISILLPKDIKIIAKNESQKNLINSIKNNEITIVAGPAGTGKTYITMAYALSLLRKTTNKFKKIYLVKSVTTLKNEEVGFLKGDLNEKIEPVMWSFYLNMEKLILESSIKSLIEKEIVRPFPLAYMRGTSLDDSIIIADEMQNVNLDNSRTLLTRIGSNSKLILLGDINQIDMKNKNESSLEVLLNLFEDVSNIGVIRMSEEDTNIRNPLISVIETKYKEYINKIPKNGKKIQLNG
ncbi:PhoH family protein [Candidatus Dojkabacteria bacterium]|jgi:phosphate starvation-inducible PhoH-like protein|nr:PhoH family protein [Candidatus Dojkabacteria bacterium]